MEQKPATTTQNSKMESNSNKNNNMKRSPSELDLHEYLKKTFPHQTSDDDLFNVDAGYSDLSFSLKNRSCMQDMMMMMNGFSSHWETLTESPVLSQNLDSKRTKIAATTTTIDSQSSICAGSPTWGNYKPKSNDSEARRGTGGSSPDQSDDDDAETEAGHCEQSPNPIDLKRIRRKVSNRESARRSRQRRQDHMAQLESEVERLRDEYASLHRQCSNATSQFRDADTNNRVLKSNVEALRAKVKLAEDVVTRGSLTCGLNQLLQSHLTTVPQPFNTHHHHLVRQLANVSPTITVHGDHHHHGGGGGVGGLYTGLDTLSGQNLPLGLANSDINNANNNGVISDAVSCVSDIWP